MKVSQILFLPIMLLCKPTCNCKEIKDNPSKFKANEFECIDDTKFKHFVDSTNFFVKECPKGLCFTRNPPFKNPCIGKERALEIDSK